MKRNYPDKIIDDTIEKSKRLDIKDLLHPIQRNKTQSIIPLVTTYNPINPNVTPTLNEVLKTDETKCQDPRWGICPYIKTGQNSTLVGKSSLSTMTCHAKPET